MPVLLIDRNLKDLSLAWEGAAALRKALQMLRPNSAPYPKSY
jgi:hypothetical protein